MKRYKYICIILLLIIFLTLLFPLKKKEGFGIDSFNYQDENNMPFAMGPESDVPETANTSTADTYDASIYKKVPLELSADNLDPNKVFAEINSEDATKDLLLDETFAKEHPELYNKILEIVFKSYMKNPEDLEYTLKIRNKSREGSYTNLVSHLTSLSPEDRHKIKEMLIKESPSAGDCSLTYPHPSYATLHQFRAMSSCENTCKEKTKTGSCPPLAANCLVDNSKLY